MFWMFNGEGDPRIDTAPHHVPGSGSTGYGPHRHRGTVPGIIGRRALRRHVRGQRFSLPAPIRDPGQERIRHSRCGAAVCGRHGTFRAHFGRTTAPSTPTRISWSTVTVSKSAASLRHRIRHSRTPPWRADCREHSRPGMRHVSK